MAHGTPAPLLDWARWNGRKERTSATSESGRPPIWERYQRFMKDNPHVLEHALELARTELAAGAKRIGAKALWEKLRARMLKINGGKPGSFKLNNDFTALLARDLIAAEPKLEGKIELRERKTRMDSAVDATTPIKDDNMSNPIFLEHELGQGTLRLVVTNGIDPSGACRASIQRLVPKSVLCSRPHYVDLVVRHGENARGAITEALDVWQTIGNELIEVINGLDPELGRVPR